MDMYANQPPVISDPYHPFDDSFAQSQMAYYYALTDSSTSSSPTPFSATSPSEYSYSTSPSDYSLSIPPSPTLYTLSGSTTSFSESFGSSPMSVQAAHAMFDFWSGGVLEEQVTDYPRHELANYSRSQPIIPVPAQTLLPSLSMSSSPTYHQARSECSNDSETSSRKTRGRRVPVVAPYPSRTAPATSPSGKTRRFVCTHDGCGKCFVRGEHLKRHVMSLHLGQKPHTCPVYGCGKTFSRKDNLKQHVGIAH